jgi:hypothetical protein
MNESIVEQSASTEKQILYDKRIKHQLHHVW